MSGSPTITSDDVGALFAFIRRAEKLKTELRHSWLSNNRQESVAEHSWMLSLMAMAIFESIDLDVDQLKVMKMVAIHDLAEVITGDIPAFDHKRRNNKYQTEKTAMVEITADLPPTVADELMQLWQEMEARQTPEAKLAQCLDKVEVLIQHLIADIDTWDDGDFGLGPYNKDEYFDFNPYLRKLKGYVNAQFWAKMESEDTLDRIKPEHLARRKQT